MKLTVREQFVVCLVCFALSVCCGTRSRVKDINVKSIKLTYSACCVSVLAVCFGTWSRSSTSMKLMVRDQFVMCLVCFALSVCCGGLSSVEAMKLTVRVVFQPTLFSQFALYFCLFVVAHAAEVINIESIKLTCCVSVLSVCCGTRSRP